MDDTATTDPCSHCEAPVAPGALHYRIDYDIRRLQGSRIAIEHADTIATLCARCALQFDLTRLSVPNTEGWYCSEPLGHEPTDGCTCALCRRPFHEGELYESALIWSVKFARAKEEALLTISLCSSCAAGKVFRAAEPPSNAIPPYCYQCGRYTGYTGGMEGERKDYVAHQSVKDRNARTQKARICQACFFQGSSDDEALSAHQP
jgi:hypothetical protein